MDVSGATSLLFEVQACNDAHILLMKNPGDKYNDAIEIVIGKSFEVIFFAQNSYIKCPGNATIK